MSGATSAVQGTSLKQVSLLNLLIDDCSADACTCGVGTRMGAQAMVFMLASD